MRLFMPATLAAFVVLLIATPMSADAHVSEGRNWYWFLGTRNVERTKVLDPINVVIRDGRNPGRATPDEVKRVIKQFWRGRPAKGQMNSDQKVVGQFESSSYVPAGSTWIGLRWVSSPALVSIE